MAVITYELVDGEGVQPTPEGRHEIVIGKFVRLVFDEYPDGLWNGGFSAGDIHMSTVIFTVKDPDFQVVRRELRRQMIHHLRAEPNFGDSPLWYPPHSLNPCCEIQLGQVPETRYLNGWTEFNLATED